MYLEEEEEKNLIKKKQKTSSYKFKNNFIEKTK